eukprot:UN13651
MFWLKEISYHFESVNGTFSILLQKLEMVHLKENSGLMYVLYFRNIRCKCVKTYHTRYMDIKSSF